MQRKWMRWTALPLLLLAALLTVVFPAMAADDEPEFGGSVGVRLLDYGTCGSIQWEFYADGDLQLSGSGAVEDNCTAWAAYNSKITKVYIYSGVTGIGKNVFADCTGITAVRYGGTYPGWCKVKVGENNAPLTTIAVTFPKYSGWVSENGTWYYYDTNHRPVMNDWMKDSVGWVYLGADGAMVKNAWLTDSHGVCYVGADGYCVTNCWMQHEKGWVYLGESGSVVKNEWLRHNGKWRYLGEDGFSVINQWRKDSQGWIWLDAEGYMTYDRWITVGGNTYYCNKDGYRVTGTVEIQGVTYQFDANGVLLKEYRVEFVDWDGTVLSSVTCLSGDTVTPPADPVRAEDDQYIYTFAGWTPEVTTVTGDVTYTATYTAEKREEPEKNAISSHPENAGVKTGDTATFHVEATGDVLAYRWEYRKIWKWFNTTMEGYNTDTLTVPATGARNGYDYRCVITFADGTELISEPAELLVETFITDVAGPNDQTVVLGYKGQFTASAQGEGIKYQWQYKRPDGTVWIDTAMEGATRPTVMIETTTARDGYQYRCQITDVTGNVVYTEPATMRVLSFKEHPVETFATTGSTVEFTVSTSVDSGFTYQWQYRRSATATWTNTTLTGYNTATLTVPASGKNGYEYRCVLTGAKNSKIESKAAVLHVGEPVVITAQPRSVSATAADTVTFTVDATNVYAYQWQYRNATATKWSSTTAEGNQTATLTIAAKGKNNYKYRCALYGLDGTETYTEVAVLTVG